MSTPARRRTLRWLVRVQKRLQEARAKERDAWYSDDYQQAYQLVRLATNHHPDPYVYSFQILYGLTPEKWRQRRREWHEFMLRDSLPLPPKRPAERSGYELRDASRCLVVSHDG